MDLKIIKAQNLLTMLMVNVVEIDNLQKNLQRDDLTIEELENLYGSEFKLYMENIHIYDDLINVIKTIEKNIDNEFELAKMKRDAEMLRRVEVVEL